MSDLHKFVKSIDDELCKLSMRISVVESSQVKPGGYQTLALRIEEANKKIMFLEADRGKRLTELERRLGELENKFKPMTQTEMDAIEWQKKGCPVGSSPEKQSDDDGVSAETDEWMNASLGNPKQAEPSLTPMLDELERRTYKQPAKVEQSGEVKFIIDQEQLAKTMRVYSGWDWGEDDCIRISEAVCKEPHRYVKVVRQSLTGGKGEGNNG